MSISKRIALLVASAALLLVTCSQPSTLPDYSDPDPSLFADDAFPPVIPDDKAHRTGMGSWMQETCLSCHEDGRNDAPIVVHEGMSDILLLGKCRTCHTTSPGNG